MNRFEWHQINWAKLREPSVGDAIRSQLDFFHGSWKDCFDAQPLWIRRRISSIGTCAIDILWSSDTFDRAASLWVKMCFHQNSKCTLWLSACLLNESEEIIKQRRTEFFKEIVILEEKKANSVSILETGNFCKKWKIQNVSCAHFVAVCYSSVVTMSERLFQ